MNRRDQARSPGRRAPVPWPGAAGFTLVELITVLAVAAILAAVAAPRFFNRLSFEERGFYDQSVAAVRYAQRVAIAERRSVFVVIGANFLLLCYDAACSAGMKVRDPGAGSDYALNTPDGVTLAPVSTFSFDGLGRPSLAAALTVTVGGADNRMFTVQTETGYVLVP